MANEKPIKENGVALLGLKLNLQTRNINLKWIQIE
jgi:hypothetical protein